MTHSYWYWSAMRSLNEWIEFWRHSKCQKYNYILVHILGRTLRLGMPCANWLYFQNLITPTPLLMIKMLSWKALFWALTFRYDLFECTFFKYIYSVRPYMLDFYAEIKWWLILYLWPWHVKMIIVVFFCPINTCNRCVKKIQSSLLMISYQIH